MEEHERLNALDHAIHLFGRAWADGDRSALDALLSDSYTHIDVYGNFLRRDAWLDYAASRSGRDTAIDFEHLETKVFGDVAIITGRNVITGSGNSRRGRPRAFVSALYAGLAMERREVAARVHAVDP